MLQLSRVARFVIESGPRVYHRLYGRRDTSACHWVITFYAMSDIPSTHDLCIGHRDRERERERRDITVVTASPSTTYAIHARNTCVSNGLCTHMHMSTPHCVSITLLGLSPGVIRTIAIIKPQGTSAVCPASAASRCSAHDAID